jgi:hypothetical protein
MNPKQVRLTRFSSWAKRLAWMALALTFYWVLSLGFTALYRLHSLEISGLTGTALKVGQAIELSIPLGKIFSGLGLWVALLGMAKLIERLLEMEKRLQERVAEPIKWNSSPSKT